MASELFLLPTGSIEKTKDAFNHHEFTIHFYNDDFVIGTTDGQRLLKAFHWMKMPGVIQK